MRLIETLAVWAVLLFIWLVIKLPAWLIALSVAVVSLVAKAAKKAAREARDDFNTTREIAKL